MSMSEKYLILPIKFDTFDINAALKEGEEALDAYIEKLAKGMREAASREGWRDYFYNIDASYDMHVDDNNALRDAALDMMEASNFIEKGEDGWSADDEKFDEAAAEYLEMRGWPSVVVLEPNESSHPKEFTPKFLEAHPKLLNAKPEDITAEWLKRKLKSAVDYKLQLEIENFYQDLESLVNELNEDEGYA